MMQLLGIDLLEFVSYDLKFNQRNLNGKWLAIHIRELHSRLRSSSD